MREAVEVRSAPDHHRRRPSGSRATTRSIPASPQAARAAVKNADCRPPSKRPRRANRGSPAFERKRGIHGWRDRHDRPRADYRYFQCFRHRLPSGGWIAAPGLILPAFSTKDVDPKSSGGSEERIGTAETDVVAAKKNAPQRAPNKAVFKPLPIFSSHNFKFTLKR